MKLRKIPALLGAGLLALIMSNPVSAQSAYKTSFTTSITYTNVGSAAANITITYYPETGSAITTNPVANNGKLNVGASGSVFVGNVSQVGSSFKGAAVLSSDQPVVATLVQVPQGTTTVRNRPLSNGFTTGSSRVVLATVLKNQFNQTSVFSVQNAGSAPANFTITFKTTAGQSYTETVTGLAAGAAKYFDMGTVAALSNVPNFNGSAVIEGTGVSLVGTVMEFDTKEDGTGIGVSAFEGVTSGASQVYMPSAMCNFYGQTTYYAVQNVGTVATTAKVEYANGTSFTTPNIAPNAKFSVNSCETLAPSTTSSAKITATASGAEVVVIGKVTGAGLSTAFLGEQSGSAKLVLPYVRWTESQWNASSSARQRTYIAIQNVGAALPAGSVKIRYIDINGNTVGTHTVNTALATNGKVSVNPSEIGAAGNEFGYSGTTYGGGAIIEGPAGSQLIAVARVQSFLTASSSSGEDYNGVPIQ